MTAKPFSNKRFKILTKTCLAQLDLVVNGLGVRPKTQKTQKKHRKKHQTTKKKHNNKKHKNTTTTKKTQKNAEKHKKNSKKTQKKLLTPKPLTTKSS